jgi:fructose-bisphosphate aldolase class I
MLLASIRRHLDKAPADQQIMLKLSLPTAPNLYKPLVDDPRVMRVVALSGGYSRMSNRLLSANDGVIASFSRALTEASRMARRMPTSTLRLPRPSTASFEASRKA